MVIFSTFPSNIRSRPLFPSFGIFLVFPGLVWWSQTAWFLAEPFPRIPASLCPETTCQPPPSWNSRPELQAPPFKSKTYFSTAPIIVAACTGPIRVSTCRGEGQKKNSKKSDLLLFFRCALHFWEVVKTSNSSSACHFSMQTTLEICWRHLNRQSLQRNQYQCDKNWNFKDQQMQSHFNWYHKVCELRNIARQEVTIRTCFCITLD